MQISLCAFIVMSMFGSHRDRQMLFANIILRADGRRNNCVIFVDNFLSILLFVDKDQLEPRCTILMQNKVLCVVGLLQDEVVPMVSFMKAEKASLESYADIGGLDAQIQEIKEVVELPLTHPELYADIGIKPSKEVILYGEPGTWSWVRAPWWAPCQAKHYWLRLLQTQFICVVGSEMINIWEMEGAQENVDEEVIRGQHTRIALKSRGKLLQYEYTEKNGDSAHVMQAVGTLD